MIKKLIVKNLNEFTSFSNNFHRDINVITGINGSGKTSILRLAWYLTSANIERVFDDCKFDELKCETDSFKLSLLCESDGKSTECIKVTYSDKNNNTFKKELKPNEFGDKIESVNQFTLHDKISKPTVMFPTFRRIEGGFSYLNQKQPKRNFHEGNQYREPIEYGLSNLASRLGLYKHSFVTSISTSDIKNLLTKSYAAISHKTNELHTQMAKEVTDIVIKYRTNKKNKIEGTYIDKIAIKVDEISKIQKEKLAPFNVIQNIIGEFYGSKSIKISDSITLGSSDKVLDSDVLSAGEKQFLSFLSYNAFTTNGIIFIDEPELSLHVDWQRKLIQTLLEQNPTNQLVLATHSPFIYSMYEDHELKFEVKK